MRKKWGHRPRFCSTEEKRAWWRLRTKLYPTVIDTLAKHRKYGDHKQSVSEQIKTVASNALAMAQSVELWTLDPLDRQSLPVQQGITVLRRHNWAILVIFGRRALNFFCLKALGKMWKMTPLLCACAVVITLETQKCRKRAPRSVEFNFFINCHRQKRFSQNERRRADLQNAASHFLIFAQGLSYEFSMFCDDFTPFFRLWKTITKSLGKN